MRHQINIIMYSATTAVVLAGCASPFDDDQYSDWIERDPQTWRLTGSGAVHSRDTLTASSSDRSASGEQAGDLPPDAGPQDYVRLALERSPAIEAARQKVARLRAQVPQVTSLDDPEFTVAPIGQMAETAEGQVEVMTGISQTLPAPGKLAARGRVAQQEAEVAVRELEQVRLGVAADTRRAYWSYYDATRGIEVVQRDRDLMRQFHASAEARYKAGTAAQQDVLRASVELSDLENKQLLLEQQRTSSAGMLNSLLDRRVDAALPAPPRADLPPAPEHLDSLLAQAAANNPQLAAIHQRIQASREKLKLARLQRSPDLTVSVNYNAVSADGHAMSATGQDQWWLGFGINLPLWHAKLDAAERQALRGLFENIAELTARHNRVAFLVQDALTRVQTQQKLAVMFRDVIIPQAKQAVAAAESGYRAGRVEFLTVVDNWRKQLDFELAYHRSVAQLHQDLAELDRVIGHDPASVTRTPMPDDHPSTQPALTQPATQPNQDRDKTHDK